MIEAARMNDKLNAGFVPKRIGVRENLLCGVCNNPPGTTQCTGRTHLSVILLSLPFYFIFVRGVRRSIRNAISYTAAVFLKIFFTHICGATEQSHCFRLYFDRIGAWGYRYEPNQQTSLPFLDGRTMSPNPADRFNTYEHTRVNLPQGGNWSVSTRYSTERQRPGLKIGTTATRTNQGQLRLPRQPQDRPKRDEFDVWYILRTKYTV